VSKTPAVKIRVSLKDLTDHLKKKIVSFKFERIKILFKRDKDSLKNEVLRRNPLNKNIKEPLPEPRFFLGSGLKN